MIFIFKNTEDGLDATQPMVVCGDVDVLDQNVVLRVKIGEVDVAHCCCSKQQLRSIIGDFAEALVADVVDLKLEVVACVAGDMSNECREQLTDDTCLGVHVDDAYERTLICPTRQRCRERSLIGHVQAHATETERTHTPNSLVTRNAHQIV